jgi:hypothetical protein
MSISTDSLLIFKEPTHGDGVWRIFPKGFSKCRSFAHPGILWDWGPHAAAKGGGQIPELKVSFPGGSIKECG